MAMNGVVLGDAIIAAIDSAVGSHASASADQRTAIWHAIGTAIVAHIQTATVAVTVASVAGVTPGAGISGAGAGTGTIT